MDVAIFIFLLASILMVMIGYYLHHRDLFNPISAFVFSELLVMGFLSACSAWYGFNVFDVSEASLSNIVYIHLIYGFTVVGAYAYSRNPIRLVLSKLLQSFKLNPFHCVAKLSARYVVASVGLFAMLMLIFSSPEGVLWITSPRDAYISLRSGSSQYWLLFQVCVSLLFMMKLYSSECQGRYYLKTALLIIIFSNLMYFTGSKGAVLSIFVTAAIYINFYVVRFKTRQLFTFVAAIVSLFTLILTSNDDIDRLAVAFTYFADYVSVTSLVVDLIDQLGFMFGQASVSQLWYFVPRSLFPSKPFEYGPVILHETLFPGFAEQGHTPGVLSWATSYMDFGFAGVILSGIIYGSAARAIYLEFLRTKDLGTFVLMISFCFYAPVASAPSALFILMALFMWVVYGKQGKMTHSKNLNSGYKL